MADLEQSLEELESVKQSFKTNINNTGISTSSIEFRNMPNLINQMEKKLPTQTKTITPTTYPQSVKADTGYKLTGVEVGAVNPSDYYKPEESLTVVPKTTEQILTPSGNNVYNQVNVSAVTNNIDSNIKAENIKKNVTILGVTGTLETSSGETTNVLEEYNVTMYTDENGYNVLALDSKTSAEKNYVAGQLIKGEYSTLYLVNA